MNRFENPVLLLQGDKDKIVAKKYSDELCEYYNSVNKNHCRMIIYGGQPHVFTGKYKVIGARDRYDFINDGCRAPQTDSTKPLQMQGLCL